MPIKDCLLAGFEVQPNHPSGGFFGPAAVGENFGALLRAHPVYIDANSSLAGGYMVNFMSYRKPHWNPDFDYSHLKPYHERYGIVPGIGGTQHFCQELGHRPESGMGRSAEEDSNTIAWKTTKNSAGFYDGLEAIVLGMQDWIGRHASPRAREMAAAESDPVLRANLEEMADINERLVTEPPETFREACQWILWYQMAARMYDGSGSLGRLDVILHPYYEQDVAAGRLDDEEAIFHIACLLLRDTAYLQLGGPDADGNDVTNAISFLVLEAAHRLKIPANVGVCVGDSVDPELLRRSVEIMLEDKTGVPKFLGVEQTADGFARNGYPLELGRQRAYSGCHWSAIPGREYTMNDMVKVNFAKIFEVALQEMMANTDVRSPLWPACGRDLSGHLRRAVEVVAEGLDFHMAHMHRVFPDLVLSLLCYGPVEKGLDATNGGVEFYNLCVDGSALATVADSFAALEQRVEQEGRMTWHELDQHLQANWDGPQGERARLLMHNIPRYGSGGSKADEYALRIARTFTELVKAGPTPDGYNMIPGIFSWANTIPLGRGVGATPNGRMAGAPISHGANPDPGFRKDGAPTAMAVAIAGVQPGYGNTAPMQIEMDPGIASEEEGVSLLSSLIAGHFALGGTQINMNVMDAQKVLEAHEDPSKYPDLVVRVTGFSAYFASLSPEFRQLVVDRIIAETA